MLLILKDGKEYGEGDDKASWVQVYVSALAAKNELHDLNNIWGRTLAWDVDIKTKGGKVLRGNRLVRSCFLCTLMGRPSLDPTYINQGKWNGTTEWILLLDRGVVAGKRSSF